MAWPLHVAPEATILEARHPEERKRALQRFTQSQTRAAQSLDIWSADTGFSDSTVLLPIARLGVGVLGPIDGKRMQNIMNAYVRTFFDATLRGGDTRELSALGYDEVEVERIVRGARSNL
jgi:hypothetical protein